VVAAVVAVVVVDMALALGAGMVMAHMCDSEVVMALG
jgi:hypothetical protein